VRQLPPRRGELCSERPSGVRGLPQAPRTALGDTELRELSRREGADAARSRARLRDLPSPARPQRSRQPSELRDLPCQADATRPASRREPPALRDLPRAPRSCAAKRSGDLRDLSSRPAASRADRRQLRELPPVPQVTPTDPLDSPPPAGCSAAPSGGSTSSPPRSAWGSSGGPARPRRGTTLRRPAPGSSTCPGSVRNPDRASDGRPLRTTEPVISMAYHGAELAPADARVLPPSCQPKDRPTHPAEVC
jgi:hypothetical protein